MKTGAEIRHIFTDEFGFRNLRDYQCWIQQVRPAISPTPELVDRLSPDVVDCRDFWKVCEELFGIDPVYNQSLRPKVGVVPFPIETRSDANRMNLRLAKSLGITAFLEENAGARLKHWRLAQVSVRSNISSKRTPRISTQESMSIHACLTLSKRPPKA